ncbi:MAG: glycoside hydrolase family 127 protein [Bryobacteraceae bacterium]
MRVLGLLLLSVPLLAGDLTARFDLTYNRLLKGGPPVFDTAFVLADARPQHARRFTEFSGDVSGRYIGALAMASEARGTAIPQLEALVEQLLPLQKPDGHFGDPISTGGTVTNNDMAILWGNGRLLIGLMEYYRVRPRPEVLATARKMGDFAVSAAPLYNSEAVRKEYNGEKFAVGYICWTQYMEGLVALWRATHDDRYLALARSLAERTDRHASQHSHGFLTSVRGIVELYRATGERPYLEQAAGEWQRLMESGNVLVQGAVPEMFAPAAERDEGCSEADWLRLSLDLWRETREPKYLEEAERTLFNEFSMNQFATGDFGHHTFSGNGMQPPYARAWWCCTMHGLRAMAAVFGSVMMERDGKLWLDLPADGTGHAGGLAVRVESSLEVDGSVKLTVTATDGKAHTIAVRRPVWATSVSETEFARVWKQGETVTVKYAMATRAVREAKRGGKAAVLYGPWLLGVDAEAAPHYFDEPANENRVSVPAGERITLELARDGRFTHFRVTYLPGGYAMQPQEAVLRPVGEFTFGGNGGVVEWWLPVGGGK